MEEGSWLRRGGVSGCRDWWTVPLLGLGALVVFFLVFLWPSCLSCVPLDVVPVVCARYVRVSRVLATVFSLFRARCAAQCAWDRQRGFYTDEASLPRPFKDSRWP